ncbi:NADP-dependent oxidoreductase [Actinocrispum sp. NPDC049592]|uniref:NADP-dependent oxidoreductase n=1 Tax=Actinocrispum sp. NPDC049592 TaxID=3154835 RepID=UPI003415D3D9
MAKAVRFDEYGDVNVLQVVDVEVPEPGDGQVVVRVKAASINPGEAKIREGLMHSRWPATFPSGEGSDLAGVVVKSTVDGIDVGDEVIGFTDNRASHAEYVVVEGKNVTPKPANVPWEVAGALFVAGSTAVAAVRAVDLKPGDTVAVSGAAGGVGSLVVQLAKRTGAEVVGIAGPANHDWLASHGVKPVAYGDGLAAALAGITAFIDTYGSGYVKLALELGLPTDRINTIADFPAIAEYGVKGEGSASASDINEIAELARLVDAGELEVPIAATYPLSEVRAAYTELAKGHTRGKIVLVP